MYYQIIIHISINSQPIHIKSINYILEHNDVDLRDDIKYRNVYSTNYFHCYKFKVIMVIHW